MVEKQNVFYKVCRVPIDDDDGVVGATVCAHDTGSDGNDVDEEEAEEG